MDSTQGITLSSNELRFSKAGFYTLEGSFYVESNGTANGGNLRAWPEFYIKVNSTKDDSSGSTFYIRGAGTYVGAEGNADNRYKFSQSLKVTASDRVTFHVIAKQQLGTPALLINGTNSELKVVSIEGLKGDKGDTGSTGPTGSQGPQGIQGTQGVQGTKGDKGDTGSSGPQGTAGPQGCLLYTSPSPRD